MSATVISRKTFDDVQRWFKGRHFRPTKDAIHERERLIERVNLKNPDLVIDAGCGINPFKGHIRNLVGFDSLDHKGVDFVSTILDAPFADNCADVVILYGSCHFLDKDYVVENFSKAYSWVKHNGLIEMKVDDSVDKHDIKFREDGGWSEDFIEELEVYFNLKKVVPLHRVVPEDGLKYDFSSVKDSRKIWTWQVNKR